jgi:vacuolar protein sorting-associated protein 51
LKLVVAGNPNPRHRRNRCTSPTAVREQDDVYQDLNNRLRILVMTSPRQSTSLLRSPPSSRTSLDTLGQQSLTRAANPNARRNRAALRDYYKLKDQSQDANSSRISIADSQAAEQPHASSSKVDAFDRDDFDAVSHVRKLLETESLKELLALEHELVADVRTLDGERKALVYDNYSKLISASDTIKKVSLIQTPI